MVFMSALAYPYIRDVYVTWVQMKKKIPPKKSKKSVSYKKNGGHGHAHPSFFWYDNDSGH